MIKNRAIQGIRSWKKLLLSVWLLLSLYPWMTLTAATGAALSGFHDCFMVTGTLLQQVFVVYQKFFPVMAAGCSAYYLSRKRDGCVVLSAVVAYLTLTTVLNADILNEAFYYLKWKVDSACMYIDNPLTGLFCGYCAAKLYDSYSTIQLPPALGFFSGRRAVPILSSLCMIVVSPFVYLIFSFLFHFCKETGDALYSMGTPGISAAASFDALLLPLGLKGLIPSFYILPGMDAGSMFLGHGMLPLFFAWTAYKNKKNQKACRFTAVCALSALLTGTDTLAEYLMLIKAPLIWAGYCIMKGIFTLLFYSVPLPSILLAAGVTVCLFVYGFHRADFTLDALFPKEFGQSDATLLLEAAGGIENIAELRKSRNGFVLVLIDEDYADWEKMEKTAGFQKRENEDVVWFVFPMELGEVAYRTMQEMYHKNLSSMKLEELE